jgi:hypothetical protein
LNPKAYKSVKSHRNKRRPFKMAKKPEPSVKPEETA